MFIKNKTIKLIILSFVLLLCSTVFPKERYCLAPISNNLDNLSIKQSFQTSKKERLYLILNWIKNNRRDLFLQLPKYIQNSLYEEEFDLFISEKYYQQWQKMILPNYGYNIIFKNKASLLILLNKHKIWEQILIKSILEGKDNVTVAFEINKKYNKRLDASAIIKMRAKALEKLYYNLKENSDYNVVLRNKKSLTALLDNNEIWAQILIRKTLKREKNKLIADEINKQYGTSLSRSSISTQRIQALRLLHSNLREDSDYNIVLRNKDSLVDLVGGKKVWAEILKKSILQGKNMKITAQEIRLKYGNNMTLDIAAKMQKKALVVLRRNLTKDSDYDLVLRNKDSLVALVGGKKVWAAVLIKDILKGKNRDITALEINNKYGRNLSASDITTIRLMALGVLSRNLRKDSDYDIILKNKDSLTALLNGKKIWAEILIKRILKSKTQANTAIEINKQYGTKLSERSVARTEQKALGLLNRNLRKDSDFNIVFRNKDSLVDLVGGKKVWAEILIKLILQSKDNETAANEINKQYGTKLSKTSIGETKLLALKLLNNNLREDSDYNIVLKNKDSLVALVGGKKVWAEILIKDVLRNKKNEVIALEINKKHGTRLQKSSVARMRQSALEVLYRNLREDSDYNIILRNKNSLVSLVGGNKIWAEILIKRMLYGKNKEDTAIEINKQYGTTLTPAYITEARIKALNILRHNLREGSDYWLKTHFAVTDNSSHSINNLREIYLYYLIKYKSDNLIKLHDLKERDWYLNIPRLTEAILDYENRVSENTSSLAFNNHEMIVAHSSTPESEYIKKEIMTHYDNLIFTLSEDEQEIAVLIASGLKDLDIAISLQTSIEQVYKIRIFLQNGLKDFTIDMFEISA